MHIMLRLNTPSEFLARALVLLISGRVSSLINPPPDPAPSPDSLVKLSISKDSKRQLLEWLESNKRKRDSELDGDVCSEVVEALKQ